MSRFLALARALTGAAFRSASPVFVPTYFGLGVVGVIVFGPNGMECADVTRAALSVPAASLSLWGAWLLLTTPIARAVLELPDTFVLRSMPVPRWYFLAVSAAHLAVVEIAWIALWGRGQGPLGAFAAGAGAIGAHSLLSARGSRPIEIIAVMALAAAVGSSAPLPVLLAAAAFAAPIGVNAAFRRAPERSARVLRAPLPSSPHAALAAAHLIAVRRGDAGTLGRAILLTALGGITAPLAARGYLLVEPSSISSLSLAVAAGTLSIATSGVAASVLRAERHARWMLDASALSGPRRALAAALATAVVGSLFGLVHGSLVSVIAAPKVGPALAARLLGLASLLGALVGVISAWRARRADIEGPRRGGRALVRAVASGGLAIAALGVVGEPALALIAAAALVVFALSSRGADALPEPLCAHRAASRRRTHA